MNLFFAKLFEEYQRKNDSPVLSIVLYISVFYFFLLLCCVYLPISEVIDKVYFNNHLSYNQVILLIAVFGIMGAITYAVRHIYIKKELIFKLVEKYEYKNVNKFLINILVVLLPVAFLFAGSIITVLLKGGIILGHKYDGMF